jgi:hypothetical protein
MVSSANLRVISNYYRSPTKSNFCDISFMLTLKIQTPFYLLIFVRKNKLEKDIYFFNDNQVIFQVENLLVQGKKIGM